MPPITTTATNGDGFDNLWDEINNHKQYLGTERRDTMRLKRINYELENQVSQKLFTKNDSDRKFRNPEHGEEILNRRIDPLTAVERIIRVY